MQRKDPVLDAEINIGYPLKKRTFNRREKKNIRKAVTTEEMERKARLREGMIDLHHSSR